MRSLDIFYSPDVMEKIICISIRKANKTIGVPNIVPYKQVAICINNVDIWLCSKYIYPIFTDGLDPEDIGAGKCRDLVQYAPRLAQFYLKVNEHRLDKLKCFNDVPKKDDSSFLFIIAIGGDEAGAQELLFYCLFSMLERG